MNRQIAVPAVRRSVLSFLLGCVMLGGACAPPPGSTEPPAEADGPTARIAKLRAQISDGQAQRETWRPWVDRLQTMNQTDHVGEFFLSRLTERSLYEVDHIASLADPQVLEDPGAHPGPLTALVYLKRQLEAHGIDLLVVPIPPKSTLFPELVMTPLPADPPPLLDLPLRELYLQLELNGVEVVDLLPTMKERRFRAPRTPNPQVGADYQEAVYRRQDMHWAPYGAELAAEKIAERIRRYPWFEEVARDFGAAELDVRTEWDLRYGGVAAAMVNRGDIPRSTPKEHFPVRRVTIRGERWSHNDPTSPIMLCGDSFSDPQYGLADQLLHELGFRVDLIFTPGATALFDILRLRRDRLAQKRLLIVEVYPLFRSPNSWRQVDIFDAPEP